MGKSNPAKDNALHRALGDGLCPKSDVEFRHRITVGAKTNRFAFIFFVAGEEPPRGSWRRAVETTQLFARTAAKIRAEWLLEAAPIC